MYTLGVGKGLVYFINPKEASAATAWSARGQVVPGKVGEVSRSQIIQSPCHYGQEVWILLQKQ